MIVKNVRLKGLFSRYIPRKCFKCLPFKIYIIRIDLVYNNFIAKTRNPDGLCKLQQIMTS